MEHKSVLELAETIRAKAGLIVNATIESDIADALNDIEAAVAAARAIL